VYPALAVLQALKSEKGDPASSQEDDQVLWVGGTGGMEADLVKREGIDFEAIPAAGVHGVGLRALPGNILQLSRGVGEARRILQRFKPDVLFFTGGYVAAPMALAGRGTPTLLYVPDIEPGLALKALARFSDCIAVTAGASRAFFNRRTRIEVTGYPVRPALKAQDRAAARQSLGLTDDLPVLLVYGGSKGARSINRALLAVLPELLTEMQIVHISGQLDWPEVQAASAALLDQAGQQAVHGGRYHPFPYLHEMGSALAAADLAVTRSGAATLGEFPLFGLAAVLAPYPHAWRYQQVNALYLEQRGAACLLPDAQLGERLLPTVMELMHDTQKRQQMSQAMLALANPDAAAKIASILKRLAVRRSPERIVE
jgi:UDP-N-acetylglucosamine--N-acetylmuramyl-(pentapeptide) pyrophosphoryl-undecaprenol N-acetylglucosamine transferase